MEGEQLPVMKRRGGVFAPRITTQPVTQSVNEGDPVSLSIESTSLDSNGTTSTFTWYKDKKAVKDGEV